MQHCIEVVGCSGGMDQDGNTHVLLNHDIQSVVFRGTEEECASALSEYNRGLWPEFEEVSHALSL